MLRKIGVAGLIGLAAMAVGIVLVAAIEPVIAVGLALVVAGVGMLTYGMVSNFMKAMGLMGTPNA